MGGWMDGYLRWMGERIDERLEAGPLRRGWWTMIMRRYLTIPAGDYRRPKVPAAGQQQVRSLEMRWKDDNGALQRWNNAWAKGNIVQAIRRPRMDLAKIGKYGEDGGPRRG
jgi:hypothetical protein